MSDRLQGGVVAGSTSVSVPVILRKVTDNTENVGVLAASVTAYYWRQGGTPTALTAATDLAAITSAFSAGGWKAADATNLPGTYRLDVDNAAFATGADWVVISVKVSGCYLFVEKYPLTTNVIQTGDSFARIGAAGAGLTAGQAQVVSYAAGQDPATLLFAGSVEGAAGAAPAFTVLSLFKQLLAMSQAGQTQGMQLGSTNAKVLNPAGTKTRASGSISATGDRTVTAWDNS